MVLLLTQYKSRQQLNTTALCKVNRNHSSSGGIGEGPDLIGREVQFTPPGKEPGQPKCLLESDRNIKCQKKGVKLSALTMRPFLEMRTVNDEYSIFVVHLQI